MDNISLIKNRLELNLRQQAEHLKESQEMSYEEKMAMMEDISQMTRYIRDYEVNKGIIDEAKKPKPSVVYLEEMER